MTENLKKQRHGCLFYGCLTTCALAVVFLIAVLLGLRYVKKTFSDFIDTQAMALPTNTVSTADAEQLRHRVEAFETAVHDGKATPATAVERRRPERVDRLQFGWRHPRQGLDHHRAGASQRPALACPWSNWASPALRGRYLNGTATFALSLRNGGLNMSPETIRGKTQSTAPVFPEPAAPGNFARCPANRLDGKYHGSRGDDRFGYRCQQQGI